MPRKIEQAARPEPPLESILKSARELNCRECLLTAKDAANLLRLSPSWLAKAPDAGVLVVPAQPTDIRHNAKIDRTRLSRWASKVLAGGRPGTP